MIGLHAKHHGDGFVYGETTHPSVPTAPGSESRDGKRKPRRHLPAQVGEEIAVEGALRACCIEIDLQGGDAGFARRYKDRLDGVYAILIIEKRC